MNLHVNFASHGHDLKDAYEAIIRPSDPKNGDNWALFGYDKGSNDLTVLERGNGGLEELQDEFVDGKIQYAFVRIADPNSQLNKFVLIAWCGDGVPESKKGLFNSHLADVSRFLKGYHLQINARCEADVTPAQIMKRVQEGSGSKYSTHQENYQQERIQPLQSAYKKTEIPDIATLQRNPTKPESAPKYNIGGTKPLFVSAAAASLSRSGLSSPSRTQGRVWPPVQTAPSPSTTPSETVSSPSSKPASERPWKVSGGGSSYSTASTTASFKVQPPSSLTSYAQPKPEPAVNKAHQIRMEREAREKEERERVKREIAASEARERQVESSSGASKVAEERRLQEERERQQERERMPAQGEVPRSQGFNRVREDQFAREKEDQELAEAGGGARAAREAAMAREKNAIQQQTTSWKEEEQRRQQQEQQQKREREAKESEERQRNQREEEARRRHEEEEEERHLNLGQEEEEVPQHQFVHKQVEEHHHQQEEEREKVQEHTKQLEEEVSAATAQSVALGADALLASADHPELATAGSVSAIVLFSYEKADENEMSLFEGEIIRNVTELDVGWWSGESEDGLRSGLFPANYVEVIEHAHEHATAPSAKTAETTHGHEQHYQQQGQDYDDNVHEQHVASEHHDVHREAAGAGAKGKKPSATALYDYQATEPNEVSFVEGEAIVDIDFVSDDWWNGKTETGTTGLFPANYVEIIPY